MAERPFIKPNIIINSQSMATTITSPATIINMIPGLSYDISWTGTPVGTFTVQVSNSYSINADGSVKNAGNWTTLTLTGTAPTPAGSAGNGFIDIVGTEAYACQLVYTASSGAGNLTVYVSAKVL